MYTSPGLHSYNRLLGLELGSRVTHLGQRSIMNNLLRYKLIAKVQGINVSQNSTRPQKPKRKTMQRNGKIRKLAQKKKNLHKNKNKRVNDLTPTPKSHSVLIGS